MTSLSPATSTPELNTLAEPSFAVGDIVRVKPEQIDSFLTAIQSKLKNRIGRIAFSYDRGALCVKFPDLGRRKEYSQHISHAKTYLERVPPAEALAWEQSLAKAAADHLKKLSQGKL